MIGIGMPIAQSNMPFTRFLLPGRQMFLCGVTAEKRDWRKTVPGSGGSCDAPLAEKVGERTGQAGMQRV